MFKLYIYLTNKRSLARDRVEIQIPWRVHQEGLKNLLNKTCGAIHCDDPFWVREQLNKASLWWLILVLLSVLLPYFDGFPLLYNFLALPHQARLRFLPHLFLICQSGTPACTLHCFPLFVCSAVIFLLFSLPHKKSFIPLYRRKTVLKFWSTVGHLLIISPEWDLKKKRQVNTANFISVLIRFENKK